MIHDEELKSYLDYSEGQKSAAHRVLVELSNLFQLYEKDIRVVGGWVPDLMFPGEGHIGSVDVDILINHLKLKDAGYQSMARILLNHGYREHPDKYFSFIKTIRLGDIDYDVDVDILAGMYGGTPEKKRSQHVQGMKALKATGGNFAFEFQPYPAKIEAQRPDGAWDTAHINVIAVLPYLVMKTAAMGRGKAKDAYDIYFLLKHYHHGIHTLALEIGQFKELDIVQNMAIKLKEKFSSEKHAGPVDVADFLQIDEQEEREMICRDAYEQVQALLEHIR